MKKRSVWCAFLAALALVAAVGAQHQASTGLAVQVTPEAHLDPTQVALRFQVSEDGTGDITSQTQAIAAWVRALPNQQIRVTARLENVTGPDSARLASGIQFSGSATRATEGARGATCASGSFVGGAAQELVAGWRRNGRLTCSVRFALANPRSLQPGVYAAVLSLAVRAE